MSHPLPDNLASPQPTHAWIVWTVVGGALALTNVVLLAWAVTL